MSASDDPAGAVSERAWTIYACPVCGCRAGVNGGVACFDCLMDRGATVERVPVEVVSADWRAAALKLADNIEAYFRRFPEEESWQQHDLDIALALIRTKEKQSG